MIELSTGDLIWNNEYGCCCIVIAQNALAYYVDWQNCPKLALENTRHWLFKKSIIDKNKYKIYKCDMEN